MANDKKMGLGARIAIVAVVLVAVFACFGIIVSGDDGKTGNSQKSSSSSSASVSQEAAQPEEETVQGATMSVTLKGIEDQSAIQSAQFSMIAENDSDTECTFAIDLQTAVVNNTNFTPLGGSLAVVQPGNNVALVYQAPFVQFGASSFDEVQQIEFDVVQYAGDSMINPDGSSTEIDRVHVVMVP